MFKVEIGQFWVKKDMPNYAYEVEKVITSNKGYISAECHVWYRGSKERKFMKISLEPAVLTVRFVDREGWEILRLADLTP